MFSGSRDWIHDPWKGRVNARNEKTRLSAGSSKGLVLRAPSLRGNRFGGTVLPKHLLSLRHEGACIKAKFPRIPVTARVVWVVGPSDDSAQHVIASYWGNRRELAPDGDDRARLDRH